MREPPPEPRVYIIAISHGRIACSPPADCLSRITKLTNPRLFVYACSFAYLFRDVCTFVCVGHKGVELLFGARNATDTHVKSAIECVTDFLHKFCTGSCRGRLSVYELMPFL